VKMSLKGHIPKPNAILKVGAANPQRRKAHAARVKVLAAANKERRRKYSKKIIREALIASNGILSRAAKQLGCSRTTITEWLERCPDLDQELQDIKESYVDLAESSLLSQIAEKNTQATIFLLRSLGRKRGWVDSPTEHIHALALPGTGTWMDIMKRAMSSGELHDANEIQLEPSSCKIKTLPMVTDGQSEKEDSE
jgi:hypothetical protein